MANFNPEQMLTMTIMSTALGNKELEVGKIIILFILYILHSNWEKIVKHAEKIIYYRRAKYVKVSGYSNWFSNLHTPSVNFSRTLKALLHKASENNQVFIGEVEMFNANGRGVIVPKISREFPCWLSDHIFLYIKESVKDTGSTTLKCTRCIYDAYVSSYTLTVDQINEEINNIVQEYNTFMEMKNNQEKKYYIPQYIKSNETSLKAYPLKSTRTFDNLHFDGKEEIVQRLDYFLNNKDRYKQTGDPHTLGFLFSGLPGTGKTSCIKAIANYTNRHVLEVPLASIKSINQLEDLFFSDVICNKHLKIKDRILLIEDIDCLADIVKKRDNDDDDIVDDTVNDDFRFYIDSDDDTNDKKLSVRKYMSKMKKKKEAITLSNLLNCMDGVNEVSDRIIIITSNHPEKLDPALIRDGRINYKHEFTMCSLNTIEKILQQYFNHAITDLTLDPALDNTLTPATVSSICKRYMHDSELCVQALHDTLASSSSS